MSELAVVKRADGRGMITLRGDLASSKMKKAVKAACGQAMPVSGQFLGPFLGDGASGVAWMSPDELLVLVPYGDVESCIAKIDKALKGQHYLAADVSDARAVFTVTGDDAREVLARLCPVDLHSDHFGIGQFRRTRMAQVAAAFWCHDTGFDVICFRSVEAYAHAVLVNAANGARTGVLSH